MSKNKKKLVIDNDYITIMRSAAVLHGPVAHLSERIEKTLKSLSELGVRPPNDWQFGYTGGCELRWYQGEMFSQSIGWCGLTIYDTDSTVRGKLGRSYDNDNGITIKGMPPKEALTVLRILVEMIDKGETK